jgi:hypothetical protein
VTAPAAPRLRTAVAKLVANPQGAALALLLAGSSVFLAARLLWLVDQLAVAPLFSGGWALWQGGRVPTDLQREYVQ